MPGHYCLSKKKRQIYLFPLIMKHSVWNISESHYKIKDRKLQNDSIINCLCDFGQIILNFLYLSFFISQGSH